MPSIELRTGALAICDDAQSLLERLGAAADSGELIEVTLESGEPVFVNPDHIVAIRAEPKPL